MNAYLGGGMTSLLYQKLREERGLAYTVFTQMQSFLSQGVMYIFAATDPAQSEKVSEILKSELAQLSKKGLSKSDLEFFRKQLKGTLLIASEDIENRMSSIAVNEMAFQEYRPVSYVLEQIDKVSLDSMENWIQQYIRPDALSFMGLFPKSGGDE